MRRAVTLWLLALLLAACRQASLPAPTPSTTPSPSPSPTSTPTPTPTPIPGLVEGKDARLLAESALELEKPDWPENRNSDKDDDVYVAHYAPSGSKPDQMVPVSEVMASLYQPFAEGLDISRYFPDARPVLVEFRDSEGKTYYVPEAVVRSALGDEYARKLESMGLPEQDMTLFLTMPSQMLEMAEGASMLKENGRHLQGTIAGDPETSPVKVRTLADDLLVVGRYDPVPDSPEGNTDPSDDLVLAIQTPGKADLNEVGSLFDKGWFFSDVEVLKPADLGLDSQEMQALPDATRDYQRTMAVWFGKFLGGMIENYNQAFHDGTLGQWSLSEHLDALPMFTENQTNEDRTFTYYRSGWVYDIGLFPGWAEDGSDLVDIRLNYPSTLFSLPLLPEEMVVGKGTYYRSKNDTEGVEVEVVRRPATFKAIAETALEAPAQNFPALGKIAVFDLSSKHEPNASRGGAYNFLFAHLAYNTMRELLGFPAAPIEVYYLPAKDGGIPPGAEKNGSRLYYSAANGKPKQRYIRVDLTAILNSWYGRLVKDVTTMEDRVIKIDALGLDVDVMKQMGVSFRPAREFGPESVEGKLPVLMEFNVDDAMAGIAGWWQPTNMKYLNNWLRKMGTYAPTYSTKLPDGRQVGEVVKAVMDSLPDGSLAVFNGPGFSPVLTFAQHYIVDQGKDIGISGSFTVEYSAGEDWKRGIYEDIYQKMLGGNIPNLKKPFDFVLPFYEYLHLDNLFYTNALYVNVFDQTNRFAEFGGEFGGTQRNFSALVSYYPKYHILAFDNFTVSPKSGFQPPWLMPGFLEIGDVVDSDGAVPFLSGFQPYKP